MASQSARVGTVRRVKHKHFNPTASQSTAALRTNDMPDGASTTSFRMTL